MKSLIPFAALVSSAMAAPIHSGHAAAELLVASEQYQPSVPIQAAIRLKMDAGWHTYWTNPGEGGMKLQAEWVLPEGWKAGPIGWPVPVRFMTGDLPGFGYVGEVVLPVELTPPAVSEAVAKVSVKLDWLTCDDAACVPGDAAPAVEFKLAGKEAKPVPGANAQVITAAWSKVPQAQEGWALNVTESGKSLKLQLTVPKGMDAVKLAAFPETPQVVDPGAKIQFEKQGETLSATVARSEYLSGAPKTLALVLSGTGLPHPVRVVWNP